METRIRPLTEAELALWKRAKSLGAGYKAGTNFTPLDYILSGRTEELQVLILGKEG